MADKTIIITGGSSGLGYQCAKEMAKSGSAWHIIIASRNLSRVNNAVSRLVAETSYRNIQGMVLDLASLHSVRQFVQHFISSNLPPLQALVCNAGIQVISGTTYTEDGFEMTFGVNHLGHFLLANLLLPYMRESSRIVFVSSDTHDSAANTGMPAPQYQSPFQMAFPNLSDQVNDAAEVGRCRYTTSKLCNLLCTYEFSRRLQRIGLGISVNAFNPGLMLDTQLIRDYGRGDIFTLTLKNLSNFLGQILRFRNSKKMGKALAWLVLDSKLNGVTGQYFDGFKPIASSTESRNTHKAAELWEVSVALVNLTPTEALLGMFTSLPSPPDLP